MLLDSCEALARLAGTPNKSSLVRAQVFPGRQIRMVVSFGAGDTTDFLARVVVEKMAELGAGRLLVENKASGGVGTGLHLHGEMFNWRAGTKITAVAYRGTAPALTGLLTGQIHVLFTGGPTAGAHVASGVVRLLATTGTERLIALRDTPTSRAPVFDFIAAQWFGVMTTAGVPAPVLARLNKWVTRAVADPVVSRRNPEQGGIAKLGAAAAFEAHIRKQTSVWRDVIHAANISI